MWFMVHQEKMVVVMTNKNQEDCQGRQYCLNNLLFSARSILGNGKTVSPSL